MFEKIRKHFIDYFPFIAFAMIILYACRGFLFIPGNILFGEFISSTDFAFFLKDALKAWSDYTILGHSNIGFPTTYGLHPAYLITPQRGFIWFGLLSFFQLITGTFASKLYIMVVLSAPFLGMYFFARFWFRQYQGNGLLYQSLSFVSGVLYTINAAVGDRIFAGHTIYSVGYGLMPLYLFFFCSLLEEKSRNRKIVFTLSAGIIFSLLLWAMPHLLIFCIFFLSVYFLLFVVGDKEKIKLFFVIGIVSTIIGFLLDINLWFPALFYLETIPFFKNSEYILLYAYNVAPYVTFDKILTFASAGENGILTKAAYQNLFALRLFLPITAGVLFVMNKNRRKSFFLLSIALFGLVFGMGVNFPFEKFYGFLYEHLFLLEPFRDTSKFVIMYAFGLSLILSTLFVYIHKISRKLVLPAVFALILFILYVNPMFTSGNFAGNIVPFGYPHKYNVLRDLLAKDKNHYRVAVYPNDQYMKSYDWFPKIPNSSIHPTIFSSLVPLDKGLAVSNRTVSNYSSQYLDYIESNLDKQWAVERLGNAGVKYIIVDRDMAGYQRYLQSLETNTAVSEIKLVNGFTVFTIKNFSDKPFRTQNAVYYFGDMKGLQYIPSNISLINLGQNPITVLSKNYSSDILLFNSSLNDIFLTSLSDYRFSFFPDIRFGDGSTSFLISGETIRSFVQEGIHFYNPEGIVSGGINKQEKRSNLQQGRYRVFLSALSFPTGAGSVRVKIGNVSITKNIEKKQVDTLVWIDFGEVHVNSNNPSVAIYNLEQKYLIVDTLLIVPENVYDARLKEFTQLTQNKKIVVLNDQTGFNSLVQNEKQVTAMPQSYSPYWDICGEPTFLVDFYATGSVCKDDKSIKPSFKPTAVFDASIILTGVFSIITIGSLLVFAIKKQPKKK